MISMNVEFLLDTNIVSDIIRNPTGASAESYRRKRDAVALSIFVAAEIRYGLHRNPSTRILERATGLLEALPILSFEEPGDLLYADLRAHLSRVGTPIGANDLWIAAHALALDCTLVTANEREFRRVPGLRVGNWAV